MDGLNMYVYVRNNPVNGVDELGYETNPPPEDKIYATKVHKIQLEDGTFIESLVSEENIVTARPSETEPTESMSWWDIAKTVGEIAIGFTPLGVVQDVIDLGKAIASGDPKEIAMAGIGFIPSGDIVKSLGKAGKVLDNAADSASSIAPLSKKTPPVSNGSEELLGSKKLDYDSALPNDDVLFDPVKLERIKGNLKKKDDINTWQGADVDKMLDKNGVSAAYVTNLKLKKSGDLYLPANPTRHEVLEELIHVGQHRKKGFDKVVYKNVKEEAALEFEAHEKLLAIAKKQNWNPGEMKKLEDAHKYWKQQFKIHSK